MTDAEIIKALELCKQNTVCKGCPYISNKMGCQVGLIGDTLDLINRLQEQNAALIAGQETLQECIAKRHKEITRLQGIILAFMDEVAKMEDDGVDVSKIHLIPICDEGRNAIDRYSALAIKGFAERLKAKLRFRKSIGFPITIYEIDNLVKEMVGETDV